MTIAMPHFMIVLPSMQSVFIRSVSNIGPGGSGSARPAGRCRTTPLDAPRYSGAHPPPRPAPAAGTCRTRACPGWPGARGRCGFLPPRPSAARGAQGPAHSWQRGCTSAGRPHPLSSSINAPMRVRSCSASVSA